MQNPPRDPGLLPLAPPGAAVPPRPDLGPRAADAWAAAPATGRSPRRPSRTAIVIALFVVAGILATTIATPLLDALHQRGRSDEYRFLAIVRGEPVRWNPCEPIHYVVNLGAAPVGSLDDVQAAVLRVAGVTGIAFHYDGLTDEEPAPFRSAYQPDRYGDEWAPLLIAWVDPRTSDFDFQPNGHEAAAIAAPRTAASGEPTIYVSGVVVLNAADPNPPGFGSPGDQGPVLMHELAHIVGLGHVKEQGELMEPFGGGVTDYGPGDLEGLAQLGRGAGCLATPMLPPS